jgi:mRNA interferase RelE/StbE
VYKLVFTSQAARSLQKLPRNTADLIREKLSQLAIEPFAKSVNSGKLQGRSGYRIRIGDWRVIYEIQKKELVIIVLKIASRGEIYK